MKLNSVLMILALTAPLMASAETKGNAPCREVREEAMKACKAAGFAVGKHKEGKGLHKDCVQKIMKGESVEGVSIPADSLAACQAKREKREARKAEKASGAAIAPGQAVGGQGAATTQPGQPATK